MRGWADVAAVVAMPAVPALVSCPEGTVARANTRAADLFGESAPTALIGRRLADLVTLDGSAFRPSGGSALVAPASWPHSDDERLRVTVLVDVSDLATTPPAGYSDRDNAGLVHAEQTWRVGPSRDAERMAKLGMWEWDPSADVIRLSTVLDELLGEPSSERTTFEDYLSIVHPDDREWVRATLSPLSEDHCPVEFEARYVRRDSAVRTFQVHGKATTDSVGNAVLVGTAQDVTEQRRAAETRRYRATHDALTGLPCRGAASDRLERLLRHTHTEIAVLCCDIDDFSRVVAALGHDSADEVLRTLANKLVEGVNDACTVARSSSEDEFLIVCSDVGSAGGVETLIRTVSGLLRTTVGTHGYPIEVSASIGVAVPENGGTGAEDLMRFASAAMGEAKQRGPGQVSLANARLMRSSDWQLHLEGQLRAALRHDGLSLHYQPLVSLNGSIIGAEALVRWQHPDHGLLSPATFLPVARKGSLLRDLDQWVLRTALREAASWPSSDERPASVGVNLAELVPGDADFIDIVSDAVTESGIDWSRVTFELVETDLVDLSPKTRRVMERLGACGVRFAIDDFGTGYSSLSRLKHLPAQGIKIDREFVTGIEDDASDFAMTRAIVDMTHAMGRRCVAEGVETATQFHVLAGLGVDYYQGWLFSHALEDNDIRDLLARGAIEMPTMADGH